MNGIKKHAENQLTMTFFRITLFQGIKKLNCNFLLVLKMVELFLRGIVKKKLGFSSKLKIQISNHFRNGVNKKNS